MTKFYIINKFSVGPYIATKIQEPLFYIGDPVYPSIILADYVYSKNVGDKRDKTKYHSTNKVTFTTK